MLRIIGGTVYDPANGINGEVRDLCIEDGKIVEHVEGGKTIDARGMIVMPGGVDIHSHIAGPKVNLARKLRPEDHRYDVVPRTRITRSGVGGSVPSTFATGYRYAAMGYTTGIEAAVPPLGARHAHEELMDTPVIDKGFLVLMGNNELAMQLIKAGEREQLREYVAWLLNAARGYGMKIVNPGGVEMWKFGDNVKGLDEAIPYFEVTPRQILRELVQAANDLGLPHAAHIHCNNLGVAGNWRTTLESMKTVEGLRAHFTHIQFHSYGGKPGKYPTSKAPQIAEYINSHPNITVDVGQVMFGRTTTMTADGPLEYVLYQLTGNKWANEDVELESGCGVVPIEYKDTSYVHTIQWAIGLELFLLVTDPWRICMSTDHPNGGSFVSYPQIIKLLMDADYRREAMKRVNQKALARTTLPDLLDRTYSLAEIAIITRAAPARILGLKNKGHLGIGADADVTIYDRKDDVEEMFRTPRYVIKDGRVIVEDGHIREDYYGRTLTVAPAYDRTIEAAVKAHFDKYYTVVFENYPVQDEYLPRPEVVPCQAR